jgi:hypothetical protein
LFGHVIHTQGCREAISVPAENMVHALPQTQEDTDKILNNMKMNTEQLNKKEKIAANRLAKMRKQ